jgi:membrane-bound ClpP family serine protease
MSVPTALHPQTGDHHIVEASAMPEAGYGSESQPLSGQTGPATQPYLFKPRNGAGVAALVLGLLGLVLVLLVLLAPLGALLGLLAVVFGIMGISRAGRGEATNRGQAVTGLIAGVLALVLGVVLTVRIGGYLQDHASDVNSLARCLNAASTDQERKACTSTFLDHMKPAS